MKDFFSHCKPSIIYNFTPSEEIYLLNRCCDYYLSRVRYLRVCLCVRVFSCFSSYLHWSWITSREKKMKKLQLFWFQKDHFVLFRLPHAFLLLMDNVPILSDSTFVCHHGLLVWRKLYEKEKCFFSFLFLCFPVGNRGKLGHCGVMIELKCCHLTFHVKCLNLVANNQITQYDEMQNVNN